MVDMNSRSVWVLLCLGNRCQSFRYLRTGPFDITLFGWFMFAVYLMWGRSRRHDARLLTVLLMACALSKSEWESPPYYSLMVEASTIYRWLYRWFFHPKGRSYWILMVFIAKSIPDFVPDLIPDSGFDSGFGSGFDSGFDSVLDLPLFRFGWSGG